MKRRHTPYLNEYNQEHYVTPRRADPPWEPKRDESFPTDFVVMLGTLVAFVAVLILLWWTK